jgi:hypothetical protein
VKKNCYSRALKHLKSTEIDEKIQRLNESPTNNTSNVYSIDNGGYRWGGVDEYDPERVFYPDVDGNWPAGIPGNPGEFSYVRQKGFWDRGLGTVPAAQTTEIQNFTTVSGVNGSNTDNFIRPSDGFVLADLPPNTRNFILGPLVDGYVMNHGISVYSPNGSDYTNIGYIQKDTRQFVLLGRIKGTWAESTRGDIDIGFGLYRSYIWKGTVDEFTSYNPNFTLEHALWFRDKILSGKFTSSVPYKYSGAAPQEPDPVNPGFYNGRVPDDGKRGGKNDNQGTKQKSPTMGNAADANLYGLQSMDNLGGWLAAAAALGFVFKSIESFINWFNNQTPEMKEKLKDLVKGKEIAGSLSGPRLMDTSSPIRPSPRGPYTPLKDYGSYGKPNFMPSGPSQDPWGGRGPLGPIPQVNKNRSGGALVASRELKGQFISESRQRILREVKKPIVIQEPQIQKLKKYKPNFAGKYTPQNTPDVTSSLKSDEIVKAKNAAGQTWRTYDKHWSRYESTERLNIIYDHVGHGSQYWDKIVNKNQINKVIRDREVQEKLNIIAHEKAMLKEDPLYESPFKMALKEQETLQADKDPLFKKVSSRLKLVVDYPDKPSKAGYPNTPPPEMFNGWHPEYGQKDAYYNKLDSHSAESMPTTGNPQIDAKVLKARRIKQLIKRT